MDSFHVRESALRKQIAVFCRSAQTTSTSAPTKEPSIADLAGECSQLDAAEALLEAHQRQLRLLHEADDRLREAQRADPPTAALEPLLLCVQLLEEAQPASTQHPGAQHAMPERLAAVAEAAQRRLADGLQPAVMALMSAELAAVGWPPAFEGADPPAGRGLERLHRVAELSDAAGMRAGTAAGAEAGAVGGGEAPRSWAAEAAAAPLRAQLRRAFTGGHATDRADKPEWLFAQTLRLAKRYGPAAAALLQRRGAAAGGDFAADLTLALAEEAAAVLGDHVLPRLHAATSQSHLWVHLADEAAAFDLQLAALAPEQHAARPGACAAAVLVAAPEWKSCWHAGELEVAMTLLDECTDAAGAWDVEPPLEEASAPAAGGPQAPHREFAPPRCAAGFASQLLALAERARMQPVPSEQRSFLEAVLGGVVGGFVGALDRRAGGVRAFAELATPAGARAAAACASAAEYLEHTLEELCELPWIWALARPPGLLAEQLHALQLVRGRWVDALLEALAASFQAAAQRYLQDSVEAYAGGEAGSEPLPALRAPLQLMRGVVAAAAESFGARLFSRFWRGALLGAESLLVDEVLLVNGAFSAEGAAQFSRDCEALLSVFRPFAPRCDRHAKRLRDARALLALERAAAEKLERSLAPLAAAAAPCSRDALTHSETGRGAAALMEAAGLTTLEPLHIHRILSRGPHSGGAQHR